MKRRELLKRSAMLGLMPGFGKAFAAFSGMFANKISIGACDWSIGKSSDIAAFEVAREIGLEGIQVNMGSLSNNLHLRDKTRQQKYLEASKESGIKISSIAIAELNNIPYKSDPQTEQWVLDSIDVAANLGVQVILLAFFYNNDLRKDDAGKKEVIRRLKKAAPKAEKQGVILGIESYLSAEEHMEIIQQVGSPSVKIYYDFRNSADAGYDVIKELKWLGKDPICELHMKENGYLLGSGTLEWQKIADTLMELDYGKGWMQIEGALPKDADIVKSYQQNLQFLKNKFHYL